MKRIRLALISFAVLTLAACAPLQVRTGYNQQAPAYGYGSYGYGSYYGHGHLGAVPALPALCGTAPSHWGR